MSERDPLIIADAGPLIRLAAAGLLDAIRLTNRRVVMVDRIEEEVCGDLAKPFAKDIADWLGQMAPAVERVETLEGLAISALRERPDQADRLKEALRNSGERATREYVEAIEPEDAGEALILYEDGAVPNLMAAAMVPMTLVTTRAFVRDLAERGYNRDALDALEAVPYALKPAIRTIIEPNSAVGD